MNDIARISPHVSYVGVDDRTTRRFEALWSLPHGISYNAFLVRGRRTALIDTVEEGFGSRLEAEIVRRIGTDAVDYLVVNHMEPDHSGSIARLRRLWPDMRIVGNARTLEMIAGYYGIAEGLVEVSEGRQLDLEGCTLQFLMTPMIHWPETMMTWCAEERILFTGDAFGAFGTLDGFVEDGGPHASLREDEMRRYYACIVSKYGSCVQRALARLGALEIGAICPTHGPVWRRLARQTIDLYDRMSRSCTERGAVVAYGSMYGNTARAADCVARALASAGVEPIAVYDLSSADPSCVLRDVHRYRALVVGSPTYNGELFPEVASLLRALEERRLPGRLFASFGSFTWSGGAGRHLEEFAGRMRWEQAAACSAFRHGFDVGAEEACRELALAVAARL